MKKLLSLVLALALVLTSMSVAFASSTAPAADVADEDVKVAVERLAALGIIAGKADGKFHEDDPLTREEFAKILALLVNLGKASEAAKGTTRFSDVPATNWASGYINVAVGKGLILGRGDGTFGLGVQVTAEEAITMLIRALGYRDSWLEGTWPANMVNLADEIGLLDDVDFVPGYATRGLAAQLVNSALTKQTIKKELKGPEGAYDYGPSLLAGLGVEEVTAIVEANALVDADLEENEVVLDDGETYEVVHEEINVDTLIGREIECLINDDDEIILVSAVNGKEVPGTLANVDATPASGEKIHVLSLTGSKTKDLKLTDDTLVFINRAPAALTDLANGLFGTVVVDGKDIVSIIAYDWTEPNLLVSEYDEDDEVIRYFDLASEAELDVTDYDAVIIDGAVDELEDIEENDVIYVAEYTFDDEEYAYIYVVRNSVEGEVGRLSSAGDSIKIDDESYTLDAGAATYSDNANKTLNVYTAKSQLAGFIGEDALVVLNIVGAVRNITIGDIGSANILYGIYIANSNGTTYSASAGRQYFVDIYVPAEEDTLTYEVDKDVFAMFGSSEMVIGFTIDDDGIIDAAAEIDEIDDLDDALTYDGSFVDVSPSNLVLDDDYDFISDGSAKYFVVDETVLAYNKSANKYAAYAWDDIKGITPDDDVTAMIVVNDKGDAMFIYFTAALTDVTASDLQFAIVTDRYFAGDTYDVVTLALADGTTLDLELPGSGYANVDAYALVAFSLAGDDLDTVTEMVYGVDGDFGSNPTGYVSEVATADRVSGSRLYTKADAAKSTTAKTFVIDKDAIVVVVDVDGEEYSFGTTSDIRYNRDLILFSATGGNVEVIVVIK